MGFVSRPRWLLVPLLPFVLAAAARPDSRAAMPDLARPTEEMLAWMDARVPRSGSDESRLAVLLRVLTSDSELGLEYDPSFTASAREVFAERRFNCLSFSHLFLGLARSRGIAVDYLEIPATRFFRDGDLVLAAGHVTVGYGRGVQRRILELGTRGEQELVRAEAIPDRRAEALHYANLGAVRLLGKEYAEAEIQLRKALEIDEDLASAWTNLGVLRRRRGDVAGAEAMYRRAIEAEGDRVVALQNLFSLLVATEREDAAREIEGLLVRNDHRNPFAWLAMGEFSLEQGRLEDADSFLRRAYRFAPKDLEVLLARAEVAMAGGHTEKAMRWLRRAERVAPEDPAIARLELALQEAGS